MASQRLVASGWSESEGRDRAGWGWRKEGRDVFALLRAEEAGDKRATAESLEGEILSPFFEA